MSIRNEVKNITHLYFDKTVINELSDFLDLNFQVGLSPQAELEACVQHFSINIFVVIATKHNTCFDC